jgi:hypothetical protein
MLSYFCSPRCLSRYLYTHLYIGNRNKNQIYCLDICVIKMASFVYNNFKWFIRTTTLMPNNILYKHIANYFHTILMHWMLLKLVLSFIFCCSYQWCACNVRKLKFAILQPSSFSHGSDASLYYLLNFHLQDIKFKSTIEIPKQHVRINQVFL